MHSSGIFKESFKEIRQRHLEELAELDLVDLPLEGKPRAGYNDLVKWTENSQPQIQAGIVNRVFGGETGSPIDFNNAFMAFMESAAMYLSGALELLERSTAQIDQLADLWGMRFIMICAKVTHYAVDLVEKHPDGHPLLVGPYCGAFVPKDFTANPFIGVAFKGTSVTEEVINDLLATLTIRVPEQFLFGGQISRGFYYPMFSTYSEKPLSEPFTLVKNAIQIISSSASTTAITHVTGHSLGAAYASLCYAQLIIEGTGTTKAAPGDLYTFSSPRVARGDLAAPLSAAVTAPFGSAWRIVNDMDYITKVPASLPWPLSRDPFIHVDAPYTIYNNAKPVPGRSEIGTHPTWVIPTPWKPHDPEEYYKSLTYATTGRPPSGYDDLQMAVDALGGIDYFKDAASPSVDQRLVESVKPQDFAVTSTQCTFSIDSVDQCARGMFQVGSLVGEITAWGDATGIVPDSVTLYCNSLKDLYGMNTRCVFRVTSPKVVNVVFVADGVAVATAVVTMKSEVQDVHLEGICTWESAATPLVEKVSEEWREATEVLFEKLFTNA
ncbi:alpha/beta-hydrolase [Hymenopellis radicata]|nr:alpha/beta-hydrolase [Hymenopellis radicata]